MKLAYSSKARCLLFRTDYGATTWLSLLRTYNRATLGAVPQHAANMELRMKYADQPEKFLDSEVDLDEAVKNCMVRPKERSPV